MTTRRPFVRHLTRLAFALALMALPLQLLGQGPATPASNRSGRAPAQDSWADEIIKKEGYVNSPLRSSAGATGTDGVQEQA